MNTKALNIALVLVLAMMFGTLMVLIQKPWQVGASVTVGNSYQATTTPAVVDLTNLCPQGNNAASSTTGTLGSVNLLSTGAGGFTIYDATTTNNNLRASAATSSLVLADFQIAAVGGSYHFDISFKRGLLIDYTSGGTGIASTTISYRCGS